MIVTGAKFSTIGKELFGERWKIALGRAIGKGERTVHLYADGTVNVPRDVRKKLAVICHARGAALMRLAAELDPCVAGIAAIPATDMQ